MIGFRMFIAASLALLVGVASADAQHRGGAAPAVARWSSAGLHRVAKLVPYRAYTPRRACTQHLVRCV